MQFDRPKRRDFITFLGGAAAAWPLAARAEQRDRIPRIGVLMNLAVDDPELMARATAFAQGLQQLGWTDGRNVRIDYRWIAGDADRIRRDAAKLVALAPDLILASSNPIVAQLQLATRAVPIVFVAVFDPVGAGFVDSLARPGGNATGFLAAEFGMSAKWLELLKDIAPRVTRVAVLQDPGNPGGIPQFAAIQAVAPSFGVDLSSLWLRDADEIERAVTAFARSPNGGLIATRTTGAIVHRDLIITLAARHRLPAVYPYRLFITDGGGRGAVVRGGLELALAARRRRDRARRHRIRALPEWRPDRDEDYGGDRSSRSDHHAGGPASAAGGLPLPPLHHRRRPDLLRL